MPITNFEFVKVSVEKKGKEIPKNIKVEHRSSIRKIEKSGKNSVSVHFSFETSYSPDVANFLIEGIITLKDTSIERIVGGSGKDLRLKPRYTETVQNAIIRACLLLELILAREMRLPLPISLPVVKLEK